MLCQTAQISPSVSSPPPKRYRFFEVIHRPPPTIPSPSKLTVPDPMTSARRLYPYLKENRVKIAIGLLALITVDVLQLLIPRIIKKAVDALTITGSSLSDLQGYAVAISGIAVCIGGFRYLWRRCLLGTSRRVEEGLRNDLFAQIQTLSAGYFDQTKTGDIMAHATNDIQQIRMAAGMGMVAMNDAIILGAAAIGFMSYINLELTLYVLIPMPLIVFGTRFFSRKMHRRYRKVQQSFADLTEAVRERFAGIRVVKAYGLGQDSGRAVASESGRYVTENIKLVKVTGAFLPMMVLLTNVSMAIVLYAGGIKTMTLDITPGDLVAFINYLGLLTWPMMAMGWVTNLIQRGKASLDRIDAILSVTPDIQDRDGAVPLKTVPSTIRLESVTFAYAKDSPPVIKGVDLVLKRGEALGIVGPPGGGKTTLLSLFPRLYDINDGAIRLDGVDCRNGRLSDLRALFSLSPQEPFLFSGSIRENITLSAEVTDDDLMDAVRKAALESTVAGFPRGLDTLVGERGVVLSGGQKQRVALARVFIKPSPVLLLDDPISQVDTETAGMIIDSLLKLKGQSTLVIVSHRLSVTRIVDRVITLDAGRIAEEGAPDALMAANGYYARTWRIQAIEEGQSNVAERLRAL